MSNVADNLKPARSLRRGVLLGVCAGVLAGLAWFLIVIGTHSQQAYLIPLFGVVVAYGVFAGMRRPGRRAAVLAVAITAACLAFALFYVERHLLSEGKPVIGERRDRFEDRRAQHQRDGSLHRKTRR